MHLKIQNILEKLLFFQDSKKINNYAKKLGIKNLYKRPKYLSKKIPQCMKL